MAQKAHTSQEIRKALANTLKEAIVKHSESLVALRKRELKRENLAKGELCLLCAQLPKACVCLRKNALLGYGPGSASASMAASEIQKTDVATANREMGSFRSIASSPTKMPTGGPKMGGTAVVDSRADKKAAGTIPQAKHEPGPVAPGAKMPPAKGGKKITIADSGTGGEMRKHGDAPLPGMTPKVVGVGGKQPVGQGGGDAPKVPGGAPHPDTAAGLASVKALRPSSQNLSKLRTALAGIQAKKAAAAPAPLSSRLGPVTTQPKSNIALKAAAHADTQRMAGGSDAANLKADKRAGGVGFLNSLLSRFRPAAKIAAVAPAGSGPVRQQLSPYHGVRGMAALARSEKPLKKSFVLDKCAMCKSAEHAGMCKMEQPANEGALSGMNHSRRMLAVAKLEQPASEQGMSFNHSRNMKRVGKFEVPSTDGAVNGVNHSRTQLRVGSTKGRKPRR